MKKLYLLYLIVFCSITLSYTQTKQQKIDSLKNILINQKDDPSLKVHLLNELAWYSLKLNNPEALQYAKNALHISQNLNSKKDIATSNLRIGSAYIELEDYNNAEIYLLNALAIEKQLKDKDGLARTFAQLGLLNKRIENYKKASLYYNKALKIRIELNQSEKILKLYNNLIRLYKTSNDIHKVIITYYDKIKLLRQLEFHEKLITTHSSLAQYFFNNLEYISALNEYQKSKHIALDINNSRSLAKIYTNIGRVYFHLSKKDSAFYYLNKGLILKEKFNLNNKEIIYNNLALLYLGENDLLSATKYFDLFEQTLSTNKNKKQLLAFYHNKGLLLKRKKQYHTALSYYHRALAKAKELKKDQIQLEVLLSIAEAYEQLGDYKTSQQYNEQHIILRDHLERDQLKAREAIDKYKNIQQEKKDLEYQQKITQEKNKQQQLQLYGTIAIAIILLILFFVSHRNYRLKKQTLIAQHTAAKKEAEFDELLKNQELKSIHAMIDGQEKERKRIAQDLHDRLGSMLSMVKIHYKSVEDNLDKIKAEAREQYDRANTLLDEACVAVREISHNMVSGVLTKFGLIAALNELKAGIESTNALQVELIDHGFDDRIDNQLEINIYRIIQELISNILKHAQAQEVSIQLFKRDDNLQIMVEDDGVGFDTKLLSSFSGMGLKGIQSRVQNLNGTIDFDSRKHHGTTVTITIPLQQNTTAI